ISLTSDETIYFNLYTPGSGMDIYKSRPIDGQYSQFERLPDQINSSYNDDTPYIDPDEEYLVFASNRPGGYGMHDLYISFSNSDGSWTLAQNLGSWINGTNEDGFPWLTPDGKYFFFTNSKTGDLGYNPYWVDAEFIEELRPDTTDSSFFDKIAFYSERDGNYEIYSMDMDGSGLERLTNNSAQDVCPAFSYDGSKIAFASNVDGNYEIYIMNYDGSDLQQLTNTPGNEMDPDWSPDGARMVYSVFNTWDNGDIFMMNADGSNQHQLVNDPADDMMPVWSPDGDEIMFSAKRDGNYEIYVMDTTGNNQQRLTYSSLDEVRPRWSPDGTKIAYAVVDHSSMTGQIHLMHADGSGDTVLTDQAGLNEAPCWSPDGARIVFHSTRDGNYEIYQMNADGNDQRRLTDHPAEDGWPSWGRRCILGDANSDGNMDVSDVIYLINYLFKGGPPPVPLLAGDSNNDEEVTVSDVIFLINYLFKSGPKPSC
ncbi:MAG: dockerin type I domain-containing protein, partial [Candidatus Zixiibacteriota bacterium]